MQDNIRSWLNKRGVSDDTIALFNIHTVTHEFMGEDTIVIPVHNTDGSFAFNKYRRNPFNEHPQLPKYTYDKGGKVTLFGADKLKEQGTIVVTEGELDTLVLTSLNISAVSSTGGAMSFQHEWVDVFGPEDDVYLCFDNDQAGAQGMVRALEYLPNAKVVFIPETPGVKDITDFVSRGGDFHALLHTARSYTSLEEVTEERLNRLAQWLPVRFHDEYIKVHTPAPKSFYPKEPFSGDTTQLERAKAVPCDEIIEFKKNKALCPVHNEKTPSLQYYPKTNSCFCFGCSKSFDSIALYQAVHNVDFKTALNKMV
jgi:5S rRNA maturation endonuclease (ribonuclease M5)